MTVLLIVIVFMVAVVLSGTFSGSETGLYCVNRIRLKVRAEQGVPRARSLEVVLTDMQSALTLTLVGTNLANYVTAVSFAFLLSSHYGYGEGASEVYTTLIVTPIVFVFGEVVPKSLFQAHPDHLMSSASPFLRWARAILFLPVWMLTALSTRLTGLLDDGSSSHSAINPRKQMAGLLREGMTTSTPDDTHPAMVDRVLALADQRVHAVMTPRNSVVSVTKGTGRDKLLNLTRTRRYSLLPVYGRHPRKIEGVIEVHRLLDDPAWQAVSERMRPCARLGPHDSVASALIRLQRERARMGVVVDRGGYLLGVVTLKDLMEELVGELAAW
ncbi:MAG: DUF21 domain-containing protein [bacterium]|nr:DUF21 domain-containing protein [bacterium]